MSITLLEIRRRQERLRRALAAAGFKAALVVGRGFFDRPGSLAYFTGHIPPFISAPFDTAEGGMGLAAAIIPVLGDPVLLEMFPTRPELVAAEIRATPNVVAGTIAALREKGLDAGSLAVVDGDLLPWAFARLVQEALPGLRLAPFDAAAARMRAIKSEAEVALIRQAALVADAGLAAVREALRPGVTERALCAIGQQAALAAGADFVRYLRVHSGPWTLSGARWPQAMDRVIQEGEYVAVDIIGAAEGYGFDVLRCFVAGAPTEAQRRLTEAATAVTDAMVQACVPGATGRQIYAAGQRRAEELGYLEALDGFIGHGIGLETMEWPLLHPDDDAPLEPGMVICIEPGLKVEGVGGARIEEEVVVTPDGPVVLTVTPRTL
ncbi:MAG: M24 family metallopeptidase [Bacillota bacterium]